MGQFSVEIMPPNGSVLDGTQHPAGLDWQYVQSTGVMRHIDGNGQITNETSGHYSGHGEGVNNPSMQDVPAVGPIPTGHYTIGPQQDNVTGSGTTLRNSMRLTPDSDNDMHGRSGFLIHGDNSRGDQSASEGCIIIGRTDRDTIGQSDDNRLEVIASDPSDTSATTASSSVAGDSGQEGQSAGGSGVNSSADRSFSGTVHVYRGDSEAVN